MIILITGEPQAGKSTAAQQFVERFRGSCQWVYMRVVTDGPDPRAGFEAVSSTGRRHLIAHKTAVDSPVVVGHNQFHVDTGVIDEFYTHPLQRALADPPECFVLDEIGNMQRLSPQFTPLLDRAFAQNLDLLATIRLRDEWTLAYRHHPHAICLQATPESRDELPGLLVTIFSNLRYLDQLTSAQRASAVSLTKLFAAHNQLTQLQKLYGHALKYVAENRITPTAPGHYVAKGDHGSYQTRLAPTSCTCDLFLGQGKYEGKAGECSHLMAAKLLALAQTTA
jgi:nucleoside-triphosphatase